MDYFSSQIRIGEQPKNLYIVKRQAYMIVIFWTVTTSMQEGA
jgi:hypothetical protein